MSEGDPTASSVLGGGEPARAILQRWRYAYTHETFAGINDAEDPP